MSHIRKGLTIAKIRSDLFIVNYAIEVYRQSNSEYEMKSNAAYHLQQAIEKLIKIQIYNNPINSNPKTQYEHNIRKLILVADSLNANIYIPNHIRKICDDITSWEASTRYDTVLFLNITTLEKCYRICMDWYNILWKQGYR